jgi:hypothetical protein
VCAGEVPGSLVHGELFGSLSLELSENFKSSIKRVFDGITEAVIWPKIQTLY